MYTTVTDPVRYYPDPDPSREKKTGFGHTTFEKSPDSDPDLVLAFPNFDFHILLFSIKVNIIDKLLLFVQYIFQEKFDFRGTLNLNVKTGPDLTIF